MGHALRYIDAVNLTAVNDNVAPANSAALSYSLASANGSWGNAAYGYDYAINSSTADFS